MLIKCCPTHHMQHMAVCLRVCVFVSFALSYAHILSWYPSLCSVSLSLSLALIACAISLKVLNSINIIFVDQPSSSLPSPPLFAFRSILLIIQSVKNYLKRPKGKQKSFARFAAKTTSTLTATDDVCLSLL